MDVVRAKVYFPGVISCAETVAAGSGLRSEGVGMARGAGDCGGEVIALPIPLDTLPNKVMAREYQLALPAVKKLEAELAASGSG